MSSRALVDPELAPLLDALPPYHGLDASSLKPLRAGVEAAARQQLETADAGGIAVSEHHAPRPAADGPPVRMVLYRPHDAPAPLPALLHFHGGGGVMGRPEMRHASLLSTARDLACVVVSVDYRLAPEAPDPAPLEDGFAALSWLAGNAETLGLDPARIALGGESAGGGLAAGVALMARDLGGPRLAAQMLTYPMLDDRTGTTRPAPPSAGEFVWGAAANRFAWTARLGPGAGGPATSPYAAPARAPRLHSLPPTFLAIGALDLFLSETLAYAEGLAAAGVPVELHVYPGAYHAFDAAPGAAVVQAFKADWRGALARAFAV